MMNEQIVVETRNLTKIYGDGAEVRALDGVNLRSARASSSRWSGRRARANRRC